MLPRKTKRRKQWMVAALVVFLGFAAFLGYGHFFTKPAFTGSDRSIAVMPFVNEPMGSGNENFAIGMTDEITNRLSRVSDLRVIPGSLTRQYKGNEKNVVQLAAEFKAAAVLTGTIHQSGHQLQISALLTDTHSGQSIWKENYDFDMENVFSVQTEIAQLIAEKLNASLTEADKNNIARRPTQNLEAYNQYLNGRYFWNKRDKASLRKGVDFFERAIQLDSGYARAYSGLADCYSALGYASFEMPTIAFSKAEAAAQKALDLDSTLAEPHTSLGYIRFYYYWDWPAAETEFLKAIRLNKNYALAYDSYGYYLTSRERFPESRVAIEKALQLDPLSAFINTDIGFNLCYTQKYDRAIESLKATLELYPTFPLAHLWLGRAYQEQKMYKESILQFQQALKSNPNWPVALAAIGYVYGISGQRQEAMNVLGKMYSIADSIFVTPYGMALIYAGMDDRENAFKWLDKAYENKSHWLVWLKLDPRWTVLHSDKRFAVLINKMGLGNNISPSKRN